MANIITIITFIIVYLIHNLLFYKILLQTMELKFKNYTVYILSGINVLVAGVAVFLLVDYSVWVYLSIVLVYCSTTVICFRENILKKITWGLGMPIHLFSITMLILAATSWTTKEPIDQIVEDIYQLLEIKINTSFLCIILLMIINKVMSRKIIKLMSVQIEKIELFFSMAVCSMLLLIVNSYIYGINIHSIYLNINLMITGLVCLLLFYLGILVVAGFQHMKIQNQLLDHRLQAQQVYQQIVHSKSDITIEIDCSKGTVVNYLIKEKKDPVLIGRKYMKFRNELLLDVVHPEDKDFVMELTDIGYITEALAKKNNRYNFEYRVLRKNQIHWFKGEVSVINILDSVKAILVLTDITDKKERKFKIERDLLTGLYNKITTEDLIKMHLRSHLGGVLFVIDLDNFKEVNDILGYDIGTEVIKDVAKKLTATFRKKEDIIGRIREDKFIVFIKNNVDEVNITNIGNRINEVIAKKYSYEDKEVYVSASIGIAKVIKPLTTFADLYIDADMALYQTKGKGKNGFMLYSNENSKQE